MYFYQKVRDLPEKGNLSAPDIHHQGIHLDYKRMVMDRRTTLFVYDKTADRDIVALLNKKSPIFGKPTKLDDHTLSWTMTDFQASNFEQKLKEIDSNSSFALLAPSGIDSIEYGELYRQYPHMKVYNYSDRLIAVTGPGGKDLEGMVSGGLEINLKYGLGKGWIFPKKKLAEIERLSEA
jgi:hypothetical protein